MPNGLSMDVSGKNKTRKFTGKDMLLYDFGLETGDSIPIDNGQLFAKVTKVNYAPFGNSTVIRKQICFF